jgi:hypothetical protein
VSAPPGLQYLLILLLNIYSISKNFSRDKLFECFHASGEVVSTTANPTPKNETTTTPTSDKGVELLGSTQLGLLGNVQILI